MISIGAGYGTFNPGTGQHDAVMPFHIMPKNHENYFYFLFSINIHQSKKKMQFHSKLL